MKKEIFRKILKTTDAGQTETVEFCAGDERYVREFKPDERLIILGCGHISQPVCHIASMLGFSVAAVDDRLSFANYQRFPDAEKVVYDEFRSAIRGLEVNENDYICVVTRGHRWDGECLREILSGTHPSYLGMIGSKRRIKGLYDELESEGFDRKILESINAPIGVSINALTPVEIAVSICGELVAHRRQDYSCKGRTVLEQTNVDRGLLEFIIDDEAPKALMMVLSTSGSTPAKSGAIMAIDKTGRNMGTIGGGCSEAEILTAARDAIGTGESFVTEIDMSNEVAEEEGMVCGGTMQVLVEDIESE